VHFSFNVIKSFKTFITIKNRDLIPIFGSVAQLYAYIFETL